MCGDLGAPLPEQMGVWIWFPLDPLADLGAPLPERMCVEIWGPFT